MSKEEKQQTAVVKATEEFNKMVEAAKNTYSVAMTAENVGMALAAADMIDHLRKYMDRPEIKQRIQALQDSTIGFQTDRDPKSINKRTGQPNKPYEWEVVRDAVLEGILRGLNPVGNQINIIGGRFYCTKEGFEYLLKRKVQGLTDFKYIIYPPKTQGSSAVVECKASWKLNGKPDSVEMTIPVKADNWSSDDQIIGKAKRKLMAYVYSIVSGQSMPEGETEDQTAVVVEAVPLKKPIFKKMVETEGEQEKPSEPEDDMFKISDLDRRKAKLIKKMEEDGITWADIVEWARETGAAPELEEIPDIGVLGNKDLDTLAKYWKAIVEAVKDDEIVP